MGLEVAPFVQDFVSSNPISGDDVNQGDDHIRMMKATLKATFPSGDEGDLREHGERRRRPPSRCWRRTRIRPLWWTPPQVRWWRRCRRLFRGIMGGAAFSSRWTRRTPSTLRRRVGACYSGPSRCARRRGGVFRGCCLGRIGRARIGILKGVRGLRLGRCCRSRGRLRPPDMSWRMGRRWRRLRRTIQEFYALSMASAVLCSICAGALRSVRSNMGGSDNGLLSYDYGNDAGDVREGRRRSRLRRRICGALGPLR